MASLRDLSAAIHAMPRHMPLTDRIAARPCLGEGIEHATFTAQCQILAREAAVLIWALIDDMRSMIDRSPADALTAMIKRMASAQPDARRIQALRDGTAPALVAAILPTTPAEHPDPLEACRHLDARLTVLTMDLDALSHDLHAIAQKVADGAPWSADLEHALLEAFDRFTVPLAAAA